MIEAEGLFPDSLVIDRVADNTKYIINSAK